MTRLTVLAKLHGTDATAARQGFTRTLRSVPEPFRQKLTHDRGKEMAEHERLAADASIRVYFANPQSPWQQGTNEKRNGLLRQLFPKETDLSLVPQWELTRVATLLNNRRRKCLAWQTPREAFTEAQRLAPAS